MIEAQSDVDASRKTTTVLPGEVGGVGMSQMRRRDRTF